MHRNTQNVTVKNMTDFWNTNKMACHKQIILEFNLLNKKALETTIFVVFSAFK